MEQEHVQRMEEAGLVKEVRPGADPRRKIFALLPSGRRALVAESRRFAELADLVRAKHLVPDEG
jgi:DNA-binding MarR family transcriptional regulator